MIVLHFDLQPQFKYMNYFIYTSHQSVLNEKKLGGSLDSQLIMGILLEWVILILKNLYDVTKKLV